jgi:hypothetical protein
MVSKMENDINMAQVDKLAYTMAESVKAIGLGRDFVYSLVNSGQIGFVRKGKDGTKKVIPKFEWERWLRENLEYAEIPKRR